MTLNIAVDRPEAKWFQSRHRFAMARLIAYFCLRHPRPTVKGPEHLILAFDRDQTAAEMMCLATCVYAMTTCYIAVSLPFPLALSIAVAIPLAVIAIHVPIVTAGLVLRLLTGDGDHIRIISVIMMGMLLIVSSYVAMTTTWARFAAWFFFAVTILNCAAAVILRLLRGAVQATEERCVR